MEVMTLDVLTTLTLFFSTPSLTYSLARVCCRSTCSLGQGKCFAGFFYAISFAGFFLRNFFC